MALSHKELKYGTRNSHMHLGDGYFWTDTIKDWKCLLADDSFKSIIIDSLRNLVTRGKIRVYGYVIMPNHLHFLWEMLEMNGKEMPQSSFNKFTGHQFLRILKMTAPATINQYKVNDDNTRAHRFWQRDPLAILMDSKSKAEQKLDYIHLNPLQERWNLCDRPENYRWSSARYYETGVDEFGILTHYADRF